MLVDFTRLPAFLAASAIVVLTPGVDVFLLLRTSLRYGVRPGLLALAGIHTASVLQVGLAVSGLGALISQHPAVLLGFKWIGAAYLVYLAGTILHGLLLTGRKAAIAIPATSVSSGPVRPAAASRWYLRGLLSNLTNPKMLLFSLAFLPQFIGSAAHPTAQLTVLGATFLVVAAMWEVGVVLGAARIADRLRHPRIARSLEALSATAFLTISVALVSG